MICVLAALFRIMSPAQYGSSFRMQRQIATSVAVNHRQEMLDLLEHWCSPFHCFQLVVNRETREHRDTRGWPLGFDLLSTFGSYTGGVLSLPTIGITCDYNPGTVTGLMGKILTHGVRAVDGERFCIAQFVRPGVFERAFPGAVEPRPPCLAIIDNMGKSVSSFNWERYGGTTDTFTFIPMSHRGV